MNVFAHWSRFSSLLETRAGAHAYYNILDIHTGEFHGNIPNESEWVLRMNWTSNIDHNDPGSVTNVSTQYVTGTFVIADIIQLTEEFEFPAKTVFANDSMIIDLRLRF